VVAVGAVDVVEIAGAVLAELPPVVPLVVVLDELGALDAVDVPDVLGSVVDEPVAVAAAVGSAAAVGMAAPEPPPQPYMRSVRPASGMAKYERLGISALPASGQRRSSKEWAALFDGRQWQILR
jgi:hypothetical protein